MEYLEHIIIGKIQPSNLQACDPPAGGEFPEELRIGGWQIVFRLLFFDIINFSTPRF